jgi:hypothetical protein
MIEIVKHNPRSFRKKVSIRRKAFRKFLNYLQRDTPPGLDKLTVETEKKVWKEVDCMSCANCCKTMTPTYTPKDIKRIAAHQGMTTMAFKEKWLLKEKGSGDWINKTLPCQFLNMKNNECTIYAVRPADCSGFPHLSKKRIGGYIHVHKQNLEFCPATFKMVEKMMETVNGEW